MCSKPSKKLATLLKKSGSWLEADTKEILAFNLHAKHGGSTRDWIDEIAIAVRRRLLVEERRNGKKGFLIVSQKVAVNA